jgi:hypothetical protein
VISGSGSFVAAPVIREFSRRRQSVFEIIDLHKRLGPGGSTAACALAAATLLHESDLP